MADTNNSVDPNDLDSIDALLDEAEFESPEEETPSSAEENSAEDAGQAAEAEAENTAAEVAEPESVIADDANDLLDELQEDVSPPQPEPEPEAVTEAEPESEPETESEPEVAAEPERSVNPAFDVQEEPEAPSGIPGLGMGERDPQPLERSAEDILEKRAQSQASMGNRHKVNEMDAVKKLIIIFSSVIIALVVAAIGIGVWGALSSGPGLSEETLSKIDGIEVNTTQSLISSNAADKTLKTFEKKLDALSFQIEQLNGDLVKIEGGKGLPVAKSDAVTAAPAAKSEKTVSEAPKVAPAAVPAASEVKLTPEVTIKLDKVSAQMTSAQRRLWEINKRVKSLQSEYKHLLRSIKGVEKQMVEEQVKEAKQKKRSSTNGYQYHAPSDGYYQESPPVPAEAYPY